MSGYEQSAHLYDLFDCKENVDFFLEYALHAGEALDVGAGTGRIAIPLVEQGVRLACLEPSAAMRRQFRKKLAQRPYLRDKIRIVPGSAASFALGGSRPLAFLSGTFDHFLDRKERLSSLRNVVGHSGPAGGLVFDVFLAPPSSSPMSPAERLRRGRWEWRRCVGREVLPGRRLRVDLLFEIYRDGQLVERVPEVSTVGITSREEIHTLLNELGCSVRREFSDYAGRPSSAGDELLIVEASCAAPGADGRSS